jgi:Gas vesicle synthesis protein GvpL/GvpF
VPAPLYVYGIVEAEGPTLDLPEGVARAMPSVHACGRVAAVVSRFAGGEPTGRPTDVKAHEQVLRAVLEGRNTVLPVRFGSVYPDAEALDRELLAPRATELEGLLAEYADAVELELRVLYPNLDGLLRQLVDGDPTLARLSRKARESGSYHAQIELGEATVAAFEQRRFADRALVRERLTPFVRDWREREELPERVAGQFAFLVERSRVSEFEETAEKLAEEVHERLRLRLLGPLPPYSFVSFELEPAGAR